MVVQYLEGIRRVGNGNKKPADLVDMRVYFFIAESI
jgi:hypothetical protein